MSPVSPSRAWLAVSAAVALGLPSPVPGGDARVIFVNHAAGGTNEGTSWADAYLDLQDALDNAASGGDPCEVWVARGTYRPDRGTGDRTIRKAHPTMIFGFRGNRR